VVQRATPEYIPHPAVLTPAAPQRSGQAAAPVLVEVDALRLLTRIPLRRDTIAIAANPRDAAPA